MVWLRCKLRAMFASTAALAPSCLSGPPPQPWTRISCHQTVAEYWCAPGHLPSHVAAWCTALQLPIIVPVTYQSQTSLRDVNSFVWVLLPPEPEPLHRTWVAVHTVLMYAAEVISVSPVGIAAVPTGLCLRDKVVFRSWVFKMPAIFPHRN